MSAQKNLTEERMRIVSQILLLHHPLLSEPVVVGVCGECSEEPDGGEDEDCLRPLEEQHQVRRSGVGLHYDFYLFFITVLGTSTQVSYLF